MLSSQRLERLETEEKGQPRAETLSYTVELPGVEGRVAVELDTREVEKSLMSLAQELGYEQEEAERIVNFFKEKIEVGFGKADRPVFRGATPIDKATSHFIRKINHRRRKCLSKRVSFGRPGRP